MSEEKIVVYQTFSDPINANIVKGLLDSLDIQCFLTDENMVQLNAFYSQAVGVRLNVFEKDVQRINSILLSDVPVTDTSMMNDKTEEGIICPNCRSTNVAYGGSVKQKFGLWNIIFVFLFTIYPFIQRKAYHCFDCDHEFKKA